LWTEQQAAKTSKNILKIPDGFGMHHGYLNGEL
jgi:hypothetical protein